MRTLIRADFNRVFRTLNVLSTNTSAFPSTAPAPSSEIDGIDVILHPSSIRTAPLLSEAHSQGLDTYVQDVLTVPASLAGLPALSVPAGLGSDGWPVGVSVVGQWGCEEMVLRVGEVIERS